MKFRVGRVPAEPFVSWFVAYRHRVRVNYQQEFERVASGISMHGSSRRVGTWQDGLERTFSATKFARAHGITKTEYDSLSTAIRLGRHSLELGIVDRILTAVGRPDLLNEWYPVECFDAGGRWEDGAGGVGKEEVALF